MINNYDRYFGNCLLNAIAFRYESQNVGEDSSNVVMASYDKGNQVKNILVNIIRLWDLTSGCQDRWYYKETTYPIGQVNQSPESLTDDFFQTIEPCHCLRK